MTLLIATTNPNKVREIRHVLTGLDAQLVTLADVPPIPEPPETGLTFRENARDKALAYSLASGLVAVAEDSGLVIDVLGGDPGVRSARYLGDTATYPERFADIYRRMRARPDAPRDARFITALAVANGRTIVFETETRIEGMLAPAPAGTNGFGYDPIFFYPPFGKTTAEMTAEEKAAVSHRARAFRDLRCSLQASGLRGAAATRLIADP